MAGDDLVFRAKLIDEISGPVQRIKRNLGDAGRAAKKEFGQGFKEGVDQANRELGRADAATTKHTRGLGRLRQANNEVSTSSGQAARGVRGFASATDQGTKSSLGFVGILTRMSSLAAGFGVAGLAKLGVTTAANAEQSEVAFTTLMKSSARAKAETAWLTETAKATPFELADLTKADRTLLGFGFTSDKVRRDFITGMGDMAASIGVTGSEFPEFMRVFGQIKASGKLQAEDMNQLVDRGVSYTAVAKGMGMSVAELREKMSKGQITGEQFLGTMTKLAKTDYAGGMAAQAKTFNGVLSSFKDSVALSLAKIMEPLLPILKDIMDSVGKAFEWIAEELPGWIAGAQRAIESFSKSGEWAAIKSTAEGIYSATKGAFGWIVENKDVVISAVTGIVAAFLLFRGVNAAIAITNGLLVAMNALLAMNPLVAIIGFAVAAGVALGTFFTKTEQGRGMMAGFLKTVVGVFFTLRGVVTSVVSNVIGRLVALWSNFRLGAMTAAAAVGALPRYFATAMANAAATVTRWINTIVDLFQGLAGRVLGAIGNLGSRIADAVTPDDLGGLLRGGDTMLSHGSGSGGGLRNTIGAYGAISSQIGSTPTITNMLTGGGGKGRGSGDHQAGRALDLAGPASTLLAFRKAALARGGFAEFHGSGPRRHLHFVPPAGSPGLGTARRVGAGPMGDTVTSVGVGGGVGVVVQNVTIHAQDGTDAGRRFLAELKRIRQDELERS